MTPTKDDIKKWLKKIGKDRFWLAEQCGVNSKRSVDNWFTDAGNIPAKALVTIERLMSPERSNVPFPIELTNEQWDFIRNLAEQFKEPIISFVNTALENAAKEKAAGKPIGFLDSEPVPQSKGPHTLEFRGDVWACNLTDLELRGEAAAGSPVPLETLDSTTITVTNDGVSPADFLLRINGHSMEPDYPHAALVIVRKWQQWPDFPPAGKIVVYADHRGYSVKRLAYRNGSYALESINKDYPNLEPMDGGSIIGTVIGIANTSK